MIEGMRIFIPLGMDRDPNDRSDGSVEDEGDAASNTHYMNGSEADFESSQDGNRADA